MIRGTKRCIPETKNFDINVNIHNKFEVEVIDSTTGSIREKVIAYNVICNNMWNELSKSVSDGKSYKGWFDKITYGRGTGTPSAEDTDLFSTIATVSASNTQYGYDYKNAYCWIRQSIKIDELTSNGETITEMGIRAPTNALCTHAMLRDMNGNQISIQKGNTDIINIYATVYVHFPKEYLMIDSPIQINLKSISSAYSDDHLNSFLNWLMGRTDEYYYTYGGPRRFRAAKGRLTDRANDFNPDSGVTANFITATTTFDGPNKMYTFSGRLSADKGNNIGGISWWICSSNYRQHYSYYDHQLAIKAVPPIFNGSHIQSEAVGTGDGMTSDFCTEFDYPRNAIVYVDGTACSDVVVDDVPKYNTRMGQYLEFIDVINGEAYPLLYLNTGSSSTYPIGGLRDDRVYIYGTCIFYNPNYIHGISQFTSYLSYRNHETCTGLAVSDDLVHWDYITNSKLNTNNSIISIPEEYQYKKYWKIEMNSKSSETYLYALTASNLTGNNIHFTTPPAEGAVITIDYDTPVIAKDENHVFDMSVTLHLGEYVEE